MKAADLAGTVTGFNAVGQYIDCICGKELIKIEKRSGYVVRKKLIFEKEGFSRDLAADDGQIFLYDFCTLYGFCRKTYDLLGRWQLGSDLRSDLCALALDRGSVYCSIRNGALAALDRTSLSVKKEVPVSDSSMWSIVPYGPSLVCGTVDGRLLLLDKTSLSVERTLVLGKKNTGSLYLDGDTLYAASQDGTLFKIDLHRFQIDSMAKKAHKKMFRCAGVWRDRVVTVSYPCSEIAFWDKVSLEKRGGIKLPLRLSGRAYIENDLLYISSRNIAGIDLIPLSV